MDPWSLNWEAHSFQQSAQRWSILHALLDERLGREKLSFLSFAELPFDREIGACNSYSEMGRSPGEERREGSLVRWQASRQTAPCRLQEPTRRKWFTSSERGVGLPLSVSWEGCQAPVPWRKSGAGAWLGWHRLYSSYSKGGGTGQLETCRGYHQEPPLIRRSSGLLLASLVFCQIALWSQVPAHHYVTHRGWL